jgi:endonuclease YncB( thermonuclease family)
MYEYKVKEVVRVVDGDTVDVILDLGFGLFKKERCRVAGVDTPEKRTRNDKEKMLGNDATAFAEQWFAEEGSIIVKTEKDGKYGRMLATFYRGEECFNHRLIDEGFAWSYTGGTKIDAEDMASLMLLLNKRGYDTWEDYAEQ